MFESIGHGVDLGGDLAPIQHVHNTLLTVVRVECGEGSVSQFSLALLFRERKYLTFHPIVHLPVGFAALPLF